MSSLKEILSQEALSDPLFFWDQEALTISLPGGKDCVLPYIHLYQAPGPANTPALQHGRGPDQR